ncbi:MAG TPA: branched-chain amino acid ABC transporter permease [Bacillales bacterium]|nr:branched-chain amino acid ABC transporter permease [Bacillales bacterium]
MELVSQLLQLFFSGLTVGSIYALIAIGFVATYNVTGVLNFAQGEFAMFGALTCISLVGFGMPLFAAVVCSILIVTILGAVFERLAIHPARRSSVPVMIIITIGASIALRGIGMMIWGTNPHTLPPFTKGESIHLLHAVILPQNLWAIGIALASLVGMYVFFNKTYTGKAVTACVVNRYAARLMGIHPEWMSLAAISVCAGLGALGGIVIAPISGATYNMGLMLGMKAFVAAVIGGLTNAPAAVVGAFIIGILESFTAGLWTTGFQDAVSFAILLIVLFLLPNGIFSKSSGKRV